MKSRSGYKKARKTHHLFVRSVLIATLVLSNVYFPPAKASQIDCNDPRLSMNDIRFWNPCDVECETSGGAGSGSLGNNKDYKGDTVFNEAQMAAIKEHMTVYQEAAEKAKVPWQTIAVMHARENGLSLDYNGNGQGLFQDYSGQAAGRHYPSSGTATPEEFLSQATFAGETLKNKIPGQEEKIASGDVDAIKDAFFGYNGRAGIYKSQALDLGFDQAGADRGEGSPYVMNKADDKRDPDTNPTGWGQIKSDGGGIQYPANQDHGAFVMYAALSDGVQTSSSCGSDLGEITEGGLTEEQAKKFVMNYGKNPNNFSSDAVGSEMWTICGGPGSNCVTFSFFFNKMFTDLPAASGDGNGDQIVGSLMGKGAKGGSEPKPFSTFSASGMGGTYGVHTGIVLGIHGDTIITGHASCTLGNQGVTGEGDGSYGSGAGYIRVGKIGDNEVYGGVAPSGFAYPDNVDMEKIQQFLAM